MREKPMGTVSMQNHQLVKWKMCVDVDVAPEAFTMEFEEPNSSCEVVEFAHVHDADNVLRDREVARFKKSMMCWSNRSRSQNHGRHEGRKGRADMRALA